MRPWCRFSGEAAGAAAAGHESPSQMMGMSLEKQAALAGRPGCTRAGQWLGVHEDDTMVRVDGKPCFAMHERGSHQSYPAVERARSKRR